MPRRETLSENLERSRLIKMFKQLRSIVQKQMDGLESAEAGPSAAMLDTLCRSLKQLNGLLDDLARSERDMEHKEQAKAAMATIRADMPFRSEQPQTQTKTSGDLEDTPLKPQAEPLEFPFPTLKTK